MNIRYKFLLGLTAVFAVSQPLQAQGSPDTYSNDFINWVRTIGSDEFGGRKPMTPYETKTIDYLAGEFRHLGLKPAFGESYFQTVKEISTTVRIPRNEIRIRTARGAVRLSTPEDLMIWTARRTDKVLFNNVEFVFGGFGIDAPEYGWNDFEGTDVGGKILIVMVNDPGFYDRSLFRGRNMTYYGRWIYKLEQARKLGAAGCLIIHNEEAAGYGWHVCVNGHQESNLALFNEDTGNTDELGMQGWLNEDACRRLFEMSGIDYDKALSSAKKPGFKAIPLKAKSSFSMDVKYEIGETCNVGAVLPGTDLQDECVVFSAHWDHFGTGQPDGTGDAIYNGAADNGSGLAAILMIAKKMQKLPAPRRSILFLASTSEESGLFGSQYYCEHPVFPMEKTVTCINFDCIAPAPLTRDVTILDCCESGLGNYILSAAAAQGRYVVFDDDNTDGWFFRSDHWNFVRRGVAAVVVKAGKDLANPDKPNKYPQASWYHKPGDEYREDWDIEGAVANVNLMFSVGLGLANR
ncbi:MAG: M28 family peptidase [Bacteroidales bacterium]|nr:M28 family peptidase [Bacteroidales bacterium]